MTQREFELIAIEMRSTALSAVRGLLSSAQDAEDTAGDTMLKLWALHEELNSESHALKLARVISRNTALDLIRRNGRTRGIFKDSDTTLLSLPSEHSSSPSADIEWQEDKQWLRQRMEHLPPRELQVLTMRQTEHRSNEEIARLLGITTSSVAVMLSNARRKLFNDIKERNRQ